MFARLPGEGAVARIGKLAGQPAILHGLMAVPMLSTSVSYSHYVLDFIPQPTLEQTRNNTPDTTDGSPPELVS
jgi:hypothetical protein